MTDPNVIALLELLAHRTFWNESSPARTEAIRLVGVLRAAAEKHAAQTDGPVGIGMGGALLYPPGRAEKHAEPLGGWASDGWASEPAEAALAPADPDVVTHLIETVWLVAESFGAKRDCESCQAVVRKLDKRNLGYICLRHAVRESAAAPPVVAVGFGGATGRAMLESGERATQTGPEGWSAEVSPDRKWLAIYVGLRPGEDAGETLAKMLAPVGRGP